MILVVETVTFWLVLLQYMLLTLTDSEPVGVCAEGKARNLGVQVLHTNLFSLRSVV